MSLYDYFVQNCFCVYFRLMCACFGFLDCLMLMKDTKLWTKDMENMKTLEDPNRIILDILQAPNGDNHNWDWLIVTESIISSAWKGKTILFLGTAGIHAQLGTKAHFCDMTMWSMDTYLKYRKLSKYNMYLLF